MKKQLQSAFSKRQYMRASDFEIYYYNDYHLSPVAAHTHDYYEFYFFLEGDIEIVVEGVRYRPSPGDLLLIPPGVTHFPRIQKNERAYRRIVLWVQIGCLETLQQESSDYTRALKEQMDEKKYLHTFETIRANRLQGMAFQMIEENWAERYGKLTVMNLQMRALLLEMNRFLDEKKCHKQKKWQETYPVICDFISEHLEEDLSLERLSREFYLNKYYIAHLFKEKVGVSAHQYITKKRLEACKDALLGSEPIGEICRQYGFEEYTSFYRGFKKEYGMSPKEYRDQYGMNSEENREK